MVEKERKRSIPGKYLLSHSYKDYEEYCKLKNSALKAVKFAKKKYQKGFAESIKISTKLF